MKRLWIALVIAVFAVCLCTTEMLYTLSVTDKTNKHVNTAVKAYAHGDKAQARKTFETLSNTWNKEKGYMDIFLYHDTIDHVGTSIAAAKKYIEISDREFLVECEKIKEQLNSLKESELPKFENIL